ncbi:hypothetical protein FQN52_008378 [Onygenales sp. PD_12]|nr:hypothetical protein FQN52_008378 [Onygenales sp. PD_12]
MRYSPGKGEEGLRLRKLSSLPTLQQSVHDDLYMPLIEANVTNPLLAKAIYHDLERQLQTVKQGQDEGLGQEHKVREQVQRHLGGIRDGSVFFNTMQGILQQARMQSMDQELARWAMPASETPTTPETFEEESACTGDQDLPRFIFA